MAMPKSTQANSDLPFGLQLFHVSWSKTHLPILPVYIQRTTSFDSSNKRNFQSQKTHVFGLFVWTSGSYIHVDHILRHCTKLVPLLICWSFGVWIIFSTSAGFLLPAQSSLHSIFSSSSGPHSKIRSSASFTVSHSRTVVLPQNVMCTERSIIFRPKIQELIRVDVLDGYHRVKEWMWDWSYIQGPLLSFHLYIIYTWTSDCVANTLFKQSFCLFFCILRCLHSELFLLINSLVVI